MTTRDRLLTEGMRLFGEQGYTATSVAQIEAAAGLSPGSGSLYKHVRSKEALLTEGLEQLLSDGRGLEERLAPQASQGVAEQLSAAATAGLRRLDEERDLTRLLFRGLDAFPELLQRFGDGEINRFHRASTDLLAGLAGDSDGVVDWAAIAVVLQGATAHFWLLCDLFGQHPTDVDEDRFVAAVAALTTAMIAAPPTARTRSAAAPRSPDSQVEETR
ncbi:MAG: TetR/AcrR family transcriptional regulator [Pseudonocardia sp.]|nr:TetR/AcrR family transcriptional regulator [Pseudonocardia sp.]